MANIYLEKLANHSGREFAKGYFSPAWMEHDIAKQHGKKGPQGFKENAKSHLKGILRTNGRAIAESAGGSALGYGAGALMHKITKKNPAAALVGGMVGNYAGAVHGAVSSLNNQRKEMHQKYASAGEIARGAVSPAWMESTIAKKHHERFHGGWGGVAGSDVAGSARVGIRGMVTGGAVGGASAGLAHLLSKGKGPASTIAGTLGGVAGAAYGGIKSLSNQSKEMHEKYKALKAHHGK